ncbi:LysR family transcriptional regulator [Rhodococcus sp. SC4]|uniref:LysR family transcriptional regulator n=1 Tax=Rhodococcus sp. LB1 TaxID=1807499 RepID=UPI000769E42D|nr:LysR family transcriptional regulator [Rhodococcus sp. LB1]KXF49162.1 LysR family transcriptional regulator [Rhodococcus sp. SC4]KXX59418.1 LysR family transcriptional regulator [Rhodococcus sp. LB1]
MDIRDAEYLVAVADHGSVTKAARALFIAQPSLSQAIRTLERDLGVELFERTGRELRITAAGVSFAEAARRVLADVERARAVVDDVTELRSGTLTISVLNSLAAEPLPLLAGEFHRRFPQVVLSAVSADVPDGVGRAVRSGECDIGLTALPVDEQGLESRVLGEQEIVLALHADLAIELPDPVPVDLLGDIPMIVEIGLRPLLSVNNIAVECAHRQAVWALVVQGAGATLLPRGVAERELPGVVVRSLVPPVVREIGIVRRPDPLPPAAAAFVAVLDDLQVVSVSRNARPACDNRASS